MPRRGFGYRHFYDYEPTRPRPVEGGLKARSKRGAFARTWWADRWIRALESIMDPKRLRRGRNYARRGQVMAISEAADGIEARVMGSRLRPYAVHIALQHFADEAWERALDRLAEEAIFVAQLLAGELPHEIEEAFAAADLGLFPDKPGDLSTDCSCPDWANPCKHIAAVHYILAERFDEDPFLILRLRGRDHATILEGLRARQSAHGTDDLDEEADASLLEESESDLPLESCLDSYWNAPTAPDTLVAPQPRPEAIAPLLRRLGQAAFVSDTTLEQALGDPLRVVSASAVATAEGAEEGGGTEEDASA